MSERVREDKPEAGMIRLWMEDAEKIRRWMGSAKSTYDRRTLDLCRAVEEMGAVLLAARPASAEPVAEVLAWRKAHENAATRADNETAKLTAFIDGLGVRLTLCGGEATVEAWRELGAFTAKLMREPTVMVQGASHAKTCAMVRHPWTHDEFPKDCTCATRTTPPLPSAEPVAWIIREADGQWTSGLTYRTEERANRMVRALTSEGAHGLSVSPLYATSPASVPDAGEGEE